MGEDATAPEGGAGFEVDLSFSSGFSELMDELNMEDFFGEGHGEENDQMISKCVQNAIVRLPLADPTAQVRLVGNNVYRGAVRGGSISYLVHWNPPAMAASCAMHGQYCCISTPLVGGAQQDDLVKWLADGPRFRTGDDHMSQVPAKCYNRRLWLWLMTHDFRIQANGNKFS